MPLRPTLPLRQRLRFVALEAEIAVLGELLDRMPPEMRSVPIERNLATASRHLMGELRRLLAHGPPAELDALPADARPSHLFVALLQAELALTELLRVFAYGRRAGRILWH